MTQKSLKREKKRDPAFIVRSRHIYGLQLRPLVHVQFRQCYNLVVVLLDEIKDGITRLTFRDVGLNAFYSVEERHVALIDVAVCFCDIVDFFFIEVVCPYGA